MKKHLTGAKLTGLIGLAASLIAILTWFGINPPHLGEDHASPPPKKTSKKTTPAPKQTVQTQPLDMTPMAGSWQYRDEKVAVAGKVFAGYGTLSADTPFATFDVEGKDTFTCTVGVNDNHATPAPEFEVSLEVDGKSLWDQVVKAGQRLETLQVDLKGHRAITLRCIKAMNADGTPYTGELIDLIIAEPRISQ